jgi:hypothetical protein
MKREWAQNREMALPTSFVRPEIGDQLNVTRTFSLPGQRRDRRRKTFVVKKTGRLLSANGPDKKVREILIFDNHPDTIRLISRTRPDPYVDLTRSPRVSSKELIIVCLLIVVGLIAMFWPLL